MFSDNKRISLRQTFRLFVFDLLGASTLVLPSRISRDCGINGGLSIILGGIWGVIFLQIISKAMKTMGTDLISYFEKNQKRKMWVKVINEITIIYLFFYGIMMAGFSAYVFASLINVNLVPDESYAILTAIIIAVGSYAISGGLESRARVYEILFLFIMIPLILMIIISAKNITPEYLMFDLRNSGFKQDIINVGDKNGFLIIKNGYLVFASYSTLFCALFFPRRIRATEKDYVKRINTVILSALLISVIILMILYIDLIGNFGEKALSGMKFPAVTLMSTIHIKGNFFNRIDSFMLGIWFFTLFALTNMHLYYSSKLLQSAVGKPGKKVYIVGTLVLAYVAAIMFEYGEDFMNRYLRFLLYVGVPVLVLIPIVIIMAGCGANELEDRCFPMLAAIDTSDEGQIAFEYRFPNSGIKSDNAQDASTINLSAQSAYDFEQALTNYENALTKEPDTNHLKVVLLGEDFIEDKMQYDYMIEVMQEQELFPRNAYVCVSPDVSGLLKYEEGISMDIGSYIEEFLEHSSMNKKIKLVTIGNLMDESENNLLDLEIPYLTISDGVITIGDVFNW